VLLASLGASDGALLDFLGLGKKSTNQVIALPGASLTQDQVVQGLKEALGKGVQRAVSDLGRPDGFLTNLNVRIPMPEKLRTVERTLRAVKQDKLADDFVNTMNRAAEQAVPQAAGVFADSVKKMTFNDARAIISGTNNAATQFFRRTTETNLYEKFLPIVKQATAKTGVTSAYKSVVDKAGGSFGSLGRSFLGTDALDLDAYVTGKALDGLFLMVADEEKRIRENPTARTTELLQKVFGAVGKSEPQR
jgi:hypothetical protein